MTSREKATQRLDVAKVRSEALYLVVWVEEVLHHSAVVYQGPVRIDEASSFIDSSRTSARRIATTGR